MARSTRSKGPAPKDLPESAIPGGPAYRTRRALRSDMRKTRGQTKPTKKSKVTATKSVSPEPQSESAPSEQVSDSEVDSQREGKKSRSKLRGIPGEATINVKVPLNEGEFPEVLKLRIEFTKSLVTDDEKLGQDESGDVVREGSVEL